MNETIDLMKRHISVRRFGEKSISDEELREILEAGRMASSWKNFQSYSIIVVRSEEKKQALYDLLPQPAILAANVFLLFVGDLNRAGKGVNLHSPTFHPEGVENLLISSVDASLAAQNTLLAAESLGYGGVIIGVLREVAEDLARLFDLPDYVYPIFGIALGEPAQSRPPKPRLPYDNVIFEERYQEQSREVIKEYDKIQKDYAGDRVTTTWSERLADQFSQAENPVTKDYLTKKKLL
ncbi:nitroreductase family protein [Streptococcus himalayensis]|uniref:NADPH-dependent oxidoreductase n=1 Tax=Streptococcus himalayensis TaxID=1888195 RepID=A0A917EEA1_9STRE|nr:nitroreductase family protein [Streptococcus himalayensis]GGE29112.1 NADPH-dependent oxidoreductase [Streptococcus himalayensis]